jgi:hypothetical protein
VKLRDRRNGTLGRPSQQVIRLLVVTNSASRPYHSPPFGPITTPSPGVKLEGATAKEMVTMVEGHTSDSDVRPTDEHDRIDSQSASLVLLTHMYRPLVARAARQVLQGRRVDRSRPESGRFLRADVSETLDDVWRRMPAILSEQDFSAIPTLGNKNNLFLGALTIAAYHALLDAGVERDYAIELFADIGWKIYESMLKLPLLVARVSARDPQRRMNLVLRLLMRFPFSAPGRPGYEVKAWSEPGHFKTYWSYCAPFGFVQRYTQRHGDRGENEAFYRSWCLYDWPAADVLAGGKPGERGHYERPHTLSRGDSVCDMCWHAKPQGAQPRATGSAPSAVG